MSTPLLISKVAFKCLKLCTVTYFRSCFLQNVLSHSPGVFGYMGVPSHLVNRRSVFCQRSPTFKRSFACSRLYHLSKSIISSGIFRLRCDCTHIMTRIQCHNAISDCIIEHIRNENQMQRLRFRGHSFAVQTIFSKVVYKSLNMHSLDVANLHKLQLSTDEALPTSCYQIDILYKSNKLHPMIP